MQPPACPPVTECLTNLNRSMACKSLPLPKSTTSQLRALPPAGFVLTHVRPHVYSYSDGNYRAVIIYYKSRLVLIDFPNLQGSRAPDDQYLYISAIRQIVKKRAVHRVDMVYTHPHRDHIGGAKEVHRFLRRTYSPYKIYVWGSIETRRILIRENSPIPLPNIIIFYKPRTIHLARDLNIRLVIIGGHTRSDLAAYIPRTRRSPGFIHFADLVTPNFVPFQSFGLTPDLGTYIAACERLLKFDFSVFSAGHGMLSDKNSIRVTLEYTRYVIEAARRANNNFNPAGVAGVAAMVANPSSPKFGNSAASTLATLNLLDDACFRDVVKRWGCVLGSTIEYSRSHCRVASFYLLLNWA